MAERVGFRKQRVDGHKSCRRKGSWEVENTIRLCHVACRWLAEISLLDDDANDDGSSNITINVAGCDTLSNQSLNPNESQITN